MSTINWMLQHYVNLQLSVCKIPPNLDSKDSRKVQALFPIVKPLRRLTPLAHIQLNTPAKDLA